jgi:hypothetical protein
MSRTSPSWSTARQRYIRTPAIRITISSKRHRSLGRGRRRRSRRAIVGSNFSTDRSVTVKLEADEDYKTASGALKYNFTQAGLHPHKEIWLSRAITFTFDTVEDAEKAKLILSEFFRHPPR